MTLDLRSWVEVWASGPIPISEESLAGFIDYFCVIAGPNSSFWGIGSPLIYERVHKFRCCEKDAHHIPKFEHRDGIRICSLCRRRRLLVFEDCLEDHVQMNDERGPIIM